MSVATTIDSIDISTYNALLVDFQVSQCELTNNIMKTQSSYKPIPLRGNIGTRNITLTMDFNDGTGAENNAFHKISNLIGYLLNCNSSGIYNEVDVGDGYGYTCCFESAGTPERKAPWIQQCVFNFVGFRHKAKISKTTSAHYFTVSNTPGCDITSPIILKYTPPIGTTQFNITIGGTDSAAQNKIKCSNISEYIKIDTLYGTVKDSLGNAFHKTNMKEFPSFTGNGTLVFMSHNYERSAYLDGGTAEIEVYPVCY